MDTDPVRYFRLHVRPTQRRVLAASLAVACAISVLLDIPEPWRFGHELGYFVGSLAFAYVGAWIFHWVALEIPRHRQADRVYEAAWQVLSKLATNGPTLLGQLNSMAYGWTGGEPQDKDTLQEFTQRIWCGPQRTRSGGQILDPGRLIRNRIAYHEGQIRAIGPYVHLLDPEVAEVLVAMACSTNIASLRGAQLDAEVITVGLDGGKVERRRQTLATTHAGYYMAEYIDLCQRLRAALETAQPQRAVKWRILDAGGLQPSWDDNDRDDRDPDDRLVEPHFETTFEPPDFYLA